MKEVVNLQIPKDNLLYIISLLNSELRKKEALEYKYKEADIKYIKNLIHVCTISADGISLLSKDKKIIVIYVGAKETEYVLEDVMMKIGNMVNKMFDETIIPIILPDYTISNIHIECINPQLATDEEYAKINSLLNTYQNNINEMLEKKTKKRTTADFISQKSLY